MVGTVVVEMVVDVGHVESVIGSRGIHNDGWKRVGMEDAVKSNRRYGSLRSDRPRAQLPMKSIRRVCRINAGIVHANFSIEHENRVIGGNDYLRPQTLTGRGHLYA